MMSLKKHLFYKTKLIIQSNRFCAALQLPVLSQHIRLFLSDAMGTQGLQADLARPQNLRIYSCFCCLEPKKKQHFFKWMDEFPVISAHIFMVILWVPGDQSFLEATKGDLLFWFLHEGVFFKVFSI